MRILEFIFPNIDSNSILDTLKEVQQQGLYPAGIVAKRSTDTFLSKAIHFFQNNNYVHVEFLLSDMYTTFGSRPAKGVNFYKIEDPYLKASEGYIDILSFQKNQKPYTFTSTETTNFYKEIEALVLTNRLKYDTVGVLSVVFNKLRQDKNSFYCSELVYFLTSQIGFPLLNNIMESQNSIIYPSTICSSIHLALSHPNFKG